MSGPPGALRLQGAERWQQPTQRGPVKRRSRGAALWPGSKGCHQVSGKVPPPRAKPPCTQWPDPTTSLRGQLTLQFTLQQNDGSALSQGENAQYDTCTHRHGALWEGEDTVREPLLLEEKKGPHQRSFRSSATSYSWRAAKATDRLVTSLGLEPAPAPRHPRRGGEKLPSWGPAGAEPVGYLCWGRNKALQRQSWKCSSKKAQEGKESSREKQEGIRKRKKEGAGAEFKAFSHWGTHLLPGYHSEICSAAMAKQLKSRLEDFVSDCEAISSISSFSESTC